MNRTIRRVGIAIVIFAALVVGAAPTGAVHADDGAAPQVRLALYNGTAGQPAVALAAAEGDEALVFARAFEAYEAAAVPALEAGRFRVTFRLPAQVGRTLRRTVWLEPGHDYCAAVVMIGNWPVFSLRDLTRDARGVAAGCLRALGLVEDAGDLAGPAAEAARGAFAAELGVAPGEVGVVSVAEVDWPDSSLGCASLGLYYLPVITPGFRVMLEAAGQGAEYHTDRAARADRVHVVRCR